MLRRVASRLNGGSLARIACLVPQLPPRIMGLPRTQTSFFPADIPVMFHWGSPRVALSTSVASRGSGGVSGSVCSPECPGCGVSHLDSSGSPAAVSASNILWMGRTWHRKCLHCSGCKRALAPGSANVKLRAGHFGCNLTAQPAILHERAPLCGECLVLSGAGRCTICDKQIPQNPTAVQPKRGGGMPDFLMRWVFELGSPQ